MAFVFLDHTIINVIVIFKIYFTFTLSLLGDTELAWWWLL